MNIPNFKTDRNIYMLYAIQYMGLGRFRSFFDDNYEIKFLLGYFRTARFLLNLKIVTVVTLKEKTSMCESTPNPPTENFKTLQIMLFLFYI
jgi:hypothetical protein